LQVRLLQEADFAFSPLVRFSLQNKSVCLFFMHTVLQIGKKIVMNSGQKNAILSLTPCYDFEEIVMKSIKKFGFTVFALLAILLIQIANPQPVEAACGGIVHVDAASTAVSPTGCS